MITSILIKSNFRPEELEARILEHARQITIAFHSGGVYEYYGVPYAEYAGLLNASSHGKYFHAHIKGRYSYRKIAG